MNKKILVAGLAFLAIGAIAYYIFNASMETKEAEKPIVADGSAINQEVVNNANETENNIIPNWQLYKSEDLGFQVQYPDDWKEFDGRAIKSANFMSPEQLAAVQKESPELLESLDDVEYVSNLSIRRYASAQEAFGNKTLEEAFNDESKLIRKLGETQLDGVKAYEAIGQGEGTYYDIICENNGYVYDIQKEIIEETDRPSETERQIISSFRFIK